MRFRATHNAADAVTVLGFYNSNENISEARGRQGGAL
jgi:hypothetical protein